MFYQLFQAADTTNLGVITGEVAVPFFEKTNLSPEALGLVRLPPLSTVNARERKKKKKKKKNKNKNKNKK